MPTLSDQYKTGPLEVSLTINAIIRIGTLKKDNKKRAIIKSKTRFITIYTLLQFFLSFLKDKNRFPIKPFPIFCNTLALWKRNNPSPPPFIKGRGIWVSPFGKGGWRGILIPLFEIFFVNLNWYYFSIFSQEGQPINLTHSTAASPAFENRIKKCGSGLTLVTLVEVTNYPFFESLERFHTNLIANQSRV